MQLYWIMNVMYITDNREEGITVKYLISDTTNKKISWFSSSLTVVFAQSIKARCLVENEDVVWAVQTGDNPTTSDWSTNLLPTNVRLILEHWR